MQKKNKCFLVTGLEGPLGCDISRLAHLLDSNLKNGAEVSLTSQPPFTPRKMPDIRFCWKLGRTRGHSAVRRSRLIEKFNDLNGNWTHNLPACSIVSQASTLPCNPHQKCSTLLYWVLRAVVESPNPEIPGVICVVYNGFITIQVLFHVRDPSVRVTCGREGYCPLGCHAI
jgi:hypothetical protein